MDTEKSTSKGPKVHDVDGVPCHGIEAGVCMIPVSLFAAMTAARGYKNDLQAKNFISDMVSEFFADKIREFESSLDDSRMSEIVQEFKDSKIENDGRKSRGKVKDLQAEIDRLRKMLENAAMATHIGTEVPRNVPQV